MDSVIGGHNSINVCSIWICIKNLYILFEMFKCIYIQVNVCFFPMKNIIG